jgi:hypothetical protein
MRKQPNPIIHIIFVLVMALLITGVIFGIDSSEEKQQSRIEKMPEFDTRNEVPVYSKLQPTYLFQEFASSIMTAFITAMPLMRICSHTS